MAYSQEPELPATLLSKAKNAPERYIGTDPFGAKYTIANNEFRKTKEGKTQKYKTLSLGEIYSVDIQNPLQIVLFYRKFNTVVLLDNQMNETSRIDFSQLAEPLIAEAAGLASQNRLWLYDINTQQLGLYDLIQGKFKTITPPFTDNIKYYSNDYNYFYWVDTTNKCFMANLFGKVGFLGTVPDYDQIQVISANTAIIKKDGGLYLYSLEKQTSTPIAIVDKSFASFHYTAQILSIFTDTEINTYKITVPK